MVSVRHVNGGKAVRVRHEVDDQVVSVRHVNDGKVVPLVNNVKWYE